MFPSRISAGAIICAFALSVGIIPEGKATDIAEGASLENMTNTNAPSPPKIYSSTFTPRESEPLKEGANEVPTKSPLETPDIETKMAPLKVGSPEHKKALEDARRIIEKRKREGIKETKVIDSRNEKPADAHRGAVRKLINEILKKWRRL